MSNALQSERSAETTCNLDERRTCKVDLLSAVILAALVVKLYFMQVGDGGFEVNMPWFRLVKLVGVSVSSHIALFLGLMGICILVGRTLRRARGFAFVAHGSILAVAYLDFLLARYQGFHASYVQFGIVQEGVNGLPTLFSVCRTEDWLLLFDFPIYLGLMLFASTGDWVWNAPRWAGKASVAAFLVWNVFLFAWLGSKEERFFVWNTSAASLPVSSRKLTYPVRQAFNVFFVVMNRAEPYELPREIPADLPRAAAKGTPRTPHLLIIQVESLPGGAIEWNFDGQAVMPFLRQFAAKGAYFRNALSTKMAGGSFDADIGVLTGFHPPENSNPYAYHFNHPPYLPHLLKGAGYFNRTYDNHVPEFMRSAENHKALGIPSYVSVRDRSWKTLLPRLGVNGPGDVEFMGLIRDDLRKARRPVFYFVRTTSNHGPWIGLNEYDEVRDTVNFEFSGDATTRGLAAGLRYDDIALQRALTPLLPMIEAGELLVVIYGDHGIGIRLQSDIPPGITEQEMLVRHVPLIFVGRDLKPLVDQHLVSLHDIPVTVMNFLGIPFAQGYLGGRDLLAPNPWPPLVTPGAAYDAEQRLPLTDAQRALLRYGYGKMGAPR